MPSQLTATEISDFLDREFPQIHAGGRVFGVASVAENTVTLNFTPNDSHLRPGGTVSGPSLFALADVCAYATLLATVGIDAGRLALTSNLNISFLHRPAPVPLLGVGRMLKTGRLLSVMDIGIQRADTGQLIAQATATYAIPPGKM
ncbi:PaaI family thioesterase [Rhizobium sp. KVB221]|uniref:PaaI family thioesterase n=1 Tax=Rhizobium setariae TaxID=2801340 RepID=A0A936YRR5_9HYPH|nr:PaaI family thioesterase [Rhizobium setariae]MBL0371367.1 PaaI family thioesterase [Rhizobium setariae]